MVGGGGTPIHFRSLGDAFDEEQFGKIINGTVLGYVGDRQALVIVGFGAFNVGFVVGVNPVEDGVDDGWRFAGVGAHNGEGLGKDLLEQRFGGVEDRKSTRLNCSH